MVKVLNVISDKNIGGAGKCILTFLRHYDRAKFDVCVVLPRGSLLKPYVEELHAACIEVDGMADQSLDFGCIRALKQLFERETPDIIHAHAAMSARIAGRLYKRAKIIYTRHSVFEPPKRISKGIGKAINGAVNNYLADKIIAVAEAAKDNLTATGVNGEKIVVIKNGVDRVKLLSDAQRQAAREGYGVKSGELLLGIAARLTEVKGHITILEALRRLRDDGFPAKLLIAGTGPYEATIRDKIEELHLSDAVILAGFISDVTTFMNIIDVNVNASFGTEATSLSLLEGMSLGKPAVVSDFGGNPGVIYEGVNGFLFPTKDSQAMYQKLKQLASSEKIMNDLRDGSLKVFEKEFLAEHTTKRIETVYLEVLGKEVDIHEEKI